VKTFQRETVAKVIDEIKPLLEKHWEEIAHFKDIALDPEYETYHKAEAADRIRVFTVRATEGDLIGYGVFFLGSLHYRATKTASQDILFVLPEHRGITGYRFLEYCDNQLKAEGVKIVYHHVKVAHDFGRLLRRIGYEAVDTIYARRF
jgi:GNAT superfamily N-acetyltransferase